MNQLDAKMIYWL